MHEIKTGKARIMLVEVPEWATDLELLEFSTTYAGDAKNPPNYFRLMYRKGKEVSSDYNVKLPSGNYTYLCTTTDITEEIAAGIVDDHRRYIGEYKDYDLNTSPDNGRYSTAKWSFKSLLQKHSLTGRYAILLTDKN